MYAELENELKAWIVEKNQKGLRVKDQYCEGYSGLVPRRYCKETLLRVQRLLESRGL
jgi:hypothetical protein